MPNLKIDLHTGQIEVDGDSELLKQVYQDFKDQLLSKRNFLSPATKPSKVEIVEPDQKVGSKGNKTSQGMPNFLGDLDLFGKNGKKSLKDFFNEKKPSSFMEKNVVILYYLKEVLNLNQVGQDHVFTGYRSLGIKMPTMFTQSLIDTKRHKNWIDTNKIEDLQVTLKGINFVENELPKEE